MQTIRLATRGSLLALAQAEDIKAQIEALGYPVEICKVETKGDKDRVHDLQEIGGDGLFVRGIEQELLAGRADLAVHCGKDLPYRLHDQLMIAATPQAADPADMLIWPAHASRSDLKKIGTGSPRRSLQIARLLPGSTCVQIRGNINTRLEKLRRGEYDAIMLAKAGLDRLQVDLNGLLMEVLPTTKVLPATSQGILALQCRREDMLLRKILKQLNHQPTWERFCVERAVFCALKADCSLPVGVYAFTEKTEPEEGGLKVRVMYDGAYAEANVPAAILEAISGGDQMDALSAADQTDVSSSAGLREENPMEAVLAGVKAQLAKQVNLKADAGFVTLLGGGCGPELMTLRGQKALQAAQVVVYDDLIDDDLLRETREECSTIYVGKRYQAHSMKQEEISQLLVDLALAGLRVVRLKGGDSFVFGRGGEECLALQSHGIPYEVIPGISSSIAVPECAGIPVTHRQVARSFTVITGHTADGTGENYEALAKLEGTLVFLMGKHAYGEICHRLIQNGKDPKTPAAVISRGCSHEQQRTDGTLDTIAVLSQDAPTPAILVVGNVTRMQFAPTLFATSQDPAKGPLFGCHVTVTGSAQFVEKTGEKLSKMGAVVERQAKIKLRPLTEQIPEDFGPYTDLVFTSANGIRTFFSCLQERRVDLRSLSGKRFACIGKGTASQLAAYGIYADYIPETFTAQELGRGLAKKAGPEDHLLILRASNGSPLLTQELFDAGVAYTDCKIYEPIPQEEEQSQECSIRETVSRILEARGRSPERPLVRHSEERRFIVFGSAGGVKAYLAGHGGTLPEGLLPVCIGVYTAEELHKSWTGEALVASDYTADGIVDAICAYIDAHPGNREEN